MIPLANIPGLVLENISIGQDSAENAYHLNHEELCCYLRVKKRYMDVMKRSKQSSVLAGDEPDEEWRFLITYETCKMGIIGWDWEDYCRAHESATSDTSGDFVARECPTWIWGRFFSDPKYPEGRVWCQRCAPDDKDGRPTKWWLFISRNGELGVGDDPLTWFEE
jgi:hypothetical protein